MLAGMNQDFFNSGTVPAVVLSDGAGYGSGFDELGSCPDDGDYSHLEPVFEFLELRG